MVNQQFLGSSDPPGPEPGPGQDEQVTVPCPPDRRLVREGAGHGGGAGEGLASRGVRRAQASETPPHPQAAADTQERPAGEGALFLAQMLSGALLFLTQTRRPSGMKSAEIVGQGPGGQAWGRESFLPAELVWGP